MLIDARFNVTYDTKHVKNFYKGNVVWKGTRESLTGLWVLPLKQVGKIPSREPTSQTTTHPKTHTK